MEENSQLISEGDVQSDVGFHIQDSRTPTLMMPPVPVTYILVIPPE